MTDAKTLIAAAATGLQEAAAQMGAELDAATAAVARATDDLSAATANVAQQAAEIAALNSKVADLSAENLGLREQIRLLTPDPWAAVDKTGATDVTEAFRKLTLSGGKVPAGTYMIDPTKTIKVAAGKTLDITGCTFRLKSNGAIGYCGIELAGDNSKLVGGEIIGDRDTHDYTIASTHEWGYGVRISGKGCTVDGTKCRDCTGDGFNVDSAQDFTIANVVSDNNRRQGISVTDASNGLVADSQFLNTNGTKPQAGVDIEPNTGKYAKAVTFLRCVMKGNGWGVNVQNARASGIKFIDCDISGNRSRGMLNLGGLDVTVQGGTIKDNGDVGLAYAENTTGKVAGVSFSGNKGKALVINAGAKVDVSVKSTFQ